MVSVKERTVKGKKFLYGNAAASYKGRKRRFKKSWAGAIPIRRRSKGRRSSIWSFLN